MDKPLLIASSNPGKLREIQAILGSVPFQLLLPAQIGLSLDVVEDGSTYAENAVLKAEAYAQASGMMVLADDSGLEVAVLDGQPGLHSARYAPWDGATDADRRDYLLRNLQGKPQPWPAIFRCWVAVCVPGKAVQTFEGQVVGEITANQRGSGGFGYDPLFYLPTYGCTMAEISEAEKNRISHRARAVQAALPYLLANQA